MSQNIFTNVTPLGRGGYGGAWLTTLFGLLFFVVGIDILWTNERSDAADQRRLSAAMQMVRSVPSVVVNPIDNGKLVCVHGMLSPTSAAADPAFGLTFSGIALERDVQVYEWGEESNSTIRHTLQGDFRVDTTTYSLAWRDVPADSRQFAHQAGHRNPKMRYKTARFAPAGSSSERSLLPPTSPVRIGTFSHCPFQRPF